MKLQISNRITVTNYTQAEGKQIRSAYTFSNPAFKAAQDYGRPTFNIDRSIEVFEETNSAMLLPIGALQFLVDTFQPEVIDERNISLAIIPFNGALRPYQERFVKLLMMRTHGVGVAPTGAGKTFCGIALASRLKQRCLILVGKIDLANQWRDEIFKYTGCHAGLIGGGENTEGEQFTIALVQSLCKRDLSQLNYGLVIADECHNIPAKQAYSVINGIKAKYKYGLSATPQRRDNLEFMIHTALGPIVAEIEPPEVEGAVLPVRVTTRKVAFTAQVDSWAGFLTALVNDEGRNRMIIESAAKASSRSGTIILCGRVGHCEILGVMAQEAGLSPLVLHGQLPAKVRAERMARASEANLLIGTYSLLSEGIDLPHLTNLIFASPVSAEVNRETPAATLLRQSIGRCRRPFFGKAFAYVLDIIDKHPFGLGAFKKRNTIYAQQGFEVRHDK